MRKVERKLHIVNKRVVTGWTHISAYITMFFYISTIELVIANLFPAQLIGSSALGAISYGILVYSSYRVGVGAEKK